MKRGRTFRLDWKIENFTTFPCGPIYPMLLEDTEPDRINSPNFMLDLFRNSKFCLRCYPRDETERYISVTLKRLDSDEGPRDVDVGYEFSIVASDGMEDFKVKYLNVFKKGHYKECIRFVERVKVLSDKARYLPGNTLTLRCDMWRNPPEKVRGTFCTARSTVAIQRTSFSWEFPWIPKDHEKAKKIVPSMTQDLFELSAYLTPLNAINPPESVRPNGHDALGIDVRKLLDVPKSFYLKIRMSVVDEENKQWYLTEGEHIFSAKDEMWLHPLRVELDKIREKKECFFPDDILTLQCDLTVADGYITYQNCEWGHPVQKPTPKGLMRDLESLYRETMFWDLLITVGDLTFPTQRWMLSARCREFETVIRNMTQLQLREERRKLEVWKCVTLKDGSSDSPNKGQDGSEHMEVDDFDVSNRSDDTNSKLAEEEGKKSGTEDGVEDCMKQDVVDCGPEVMDVDTHGTLVNTEECDLKPSEDITMVNGKQSETQNVIHRAIQTEVADFEQDIKRRPKSDYLHRGKVLVETSPTTTETLDVDYYFAMIDSGVTDINIAGPNILVIRNIEKDTFKELLKYFYLDEVDDLDFELAKKLYMTADKLQLPALKKKCLCSLKDNMTMKNVYEALIVAYREDEIKASAFELLCDDMENVLLSNKWQDFAIQHPQISHETLQFMRYKRQANISDKYPSSKEIVNNLLL